MLRSDWYMANEKGNNLVERVELLPVSDLNNCVCNYFCCFDFQL